MKKKIGLFLGVTPSMGGAFQYSQRLLDAFAGNVCREYDTVVAYTSPDWDADVAQSGLPSIRVRYPGWSFRVATILTWSRLPVAIARCLALIVDPAARQLRAQGCDLWVFSSYTFVCPHMPVPGIGVIHDLMHRYERQFPEVGKPGVYLWRELAFRRLCNSARGILVDSDLGMQQAVDSYGVDPSHVHPLPFIVSREVPCPVSDEEVAKRYGLPPKFVFYPAQFWQHKNHAHLVQAVAKLRVDLPDLRLVLVGSRKNGYDEVQQLVGELGVTDNVKFLGFVPQEDMLPIYRSARALVFPSFFGPTNIPPLEAFAAGCPVAASGIYAMPEQIGGAGLLFDPASVDEIAACTRRLWEDDELCAALKARGYARVERWGLKQFSERLTEIVKTVIEE